MGYTCDNENVFGIWRIFSPAASIKNPLYIKFELITSRCGLSRDKVDGMCYVSLIFAKQIFSSFDRSFTDEFFN